MVFILIKPACVIKTKIHCIQQNIALAIKKYLSTFFIFQDDFNLKLKDAEKNSVEWQQKYNDLLHEKCDIKNKVKLLVLLTFILLIKCLYFIV